MRRGRRAWLRLALWVALPLALVWALRAVRPEDVGRALQQLTLPEAAALVAINLGIVLAFSARWWALLRSRGARVRFLEVAGYRVAAFAVSYFTPGTHFGGEPLQIHLLQRRNGVALPVATAAVVLDKTVELIANFAFLAFGLATVARLGLQPPGTTLVLEAGSLVLLLVPGLYLAASWLGRRPATWLSMRLGGARAPRWMAKVVGWLAATEFEISQARHSANGLAGAVAFTVVSWILLLAEWTLVLRFLGIDLNPGETVALVTAARLALFVPLPGAAGALEASLVFGLTTLGFEAAEALGLAIVIRVRDIFLGAVGLWLGGWLAGAEPAGEARLPPDAHASGVVGRGAGKQPGGPSSP